MWKLRLTISTRSFKIFHFQFTRRRVAVRVPADIADRTRGERFPLCCRYRQLHFPNCVQARRRTCLDAGSDAAGGLRLGCVGAECNSVPFDLSSTDQSIGYRAPLPACSSQSGNAHRENIGCTLALQAPERKKVIHFSGQDFPDLVIVIEPDCWRRNSVQIWRRNELASATDRPARCSACERSFS
jgi:hypothetical protein